LSRRGKQYIQQPDIFLERRREILQEIKKLDDQSQTTVLVKSEIEQHKNHNDQLLRMETHLRWVQGNLNEAAMIYAKIIHYLTDQVKNEFLETFCQMGQFIETAICDSPGRDTGLRCFSQSQQKAEFQSNPI
jgi:energy-coupling factor transporter ATP-binding protein EcfA2